MWLAVHGDAHREQKRERRRRIKQEVIAHYGGHCSCPPCGETRVEFLTLHHINGDGKAHRDEIAGGEGGFRFYLMLQRCDYPPGLEVRCWNCNCGAEQTKEGICPHLV